MMGEGSLLTTTHMVAHALREIESSLRDVLLPPSYQPPKDKRDGHRAEVKAIIETYRLADNPAASVWLKLAEQGSELSLPRQAHRDALAAPRRLDDTARRVFAEVEALFDTLLGTFETSFLTAFAVIDDLLKKDTPTRKDVDALRNRVPNHSVTYGHFFDRVEHPKWLDLLAGEGFFKSPPDPIREGDTIRFPPWPESRYLVRMAKVAELQSPIAEIAARIPDSENIYVLQDLADICLALPAQLSVPIVARAGKWLETPAISLLPKKLAEIANKMAAEGIPHGDPAQPGRCRFLRGGSSGSQAASRGLALP